MDSQDEELIRLLTDSTNRAILTVLNEASHGLSVTEVATRLISENGKELEQMTISLHHNYLPRLVEAGLITYDRGENIVTERNGTTSTAEWMDTDVLNELISRFRTGHRTDESTVGRLEGREDVYDYCRGLAERAEDELFLIYASDELLDKECLPYAERAIERGVEFHAGTKNEDAREFFREYLPEATIWDPQMDWMYQQASYPKVSRLIVADREKVAVGLWNEDADGTRTEIAMVGEGKTNPLVVLIRELLGPRLDHLDYQSDEFLEGLPFET
ncbi:DUF7344 domain-containing protein [Natronococcus jeotgali]|uniref:DUF7344 domain-containing protein n=1 Tax=Natronococcus jeotgali DSM 18795 TaxID=1227498 RepID=L9XWS2_9EURY|nr:hypothetical protein [Natronococcus jeotgali]ELY66220.1 hypothetical protein C492_01528 [Natronococcus jeotgali DSM 18795]